MMDVSKLSSFKEPVSKQDAIAVYADWQYGTAMSLIASAAKMSTKKVSEIIAAFPKEWKQEARAYQKQQYF